MRSIFTNESGRLTARCLYSCVEETSLSFLWRRINMCSCWYSYETRPWPFLYYIGRSDREIKTLYRRCETEARIHNIGRRGQLEDQEPDENATSRRWFSKTTRVMLVVWGECWSNYFISWLAFSYTENFESVIC